MPILLELCRWIYQTPLSVSIRESTWTFPIIESVHTLGIVLVAGTIAIFDLRLLGLLLKRTPVSQLGRVILPWTWAGFVVMFLSGGLLFISESATNYFNLAFRLKLLLLVLVGLNPLLFHLTIYKKVDTWDLAEVTPFPARAAATSSLLLWTGIIIAGRMIAYLH